MNKSGGNLGKTTNPTTSNSLVIPLYNTSPQGIIQVDDLEDLLKTRHDILYGIEIRNQRYEAEKSYSYLSTFIQTFEDKIGWNSNLENDITSHFILSLAFCKTDQERIWFASLESKLFIERLKMYHVDLEEVLQILSIPLEKQDNISSDAILEKIRFREKAAQITPSLIYRIPFEYALNLIPTMQYFLHKGYIYISKQEILLLIETVFKENLHKKLLKIFRNVDRVLSDGRIRYLINNFQSKREVETLSQAFYKVNVENINFKEVDNLAEKTFPLCMQMLNRSLNTTGHLKHWGRLQYGLFLKGIGLSLEESINFWKLKFSKTMPGDKFDKEYLYNFRHQYGKEGKRNDYIPYSCYKVQNLHPPSSAEFHGCPFKNYSEEKLKQILYEMKFKELDVLKVLEKVRGKEPSMACIKFFEAKYNNQTHEKIGIHPNYFYESASQIFRKDASLHFTDKYKTKNQKISYENKQPDE